MRVPLVILALLTLCTGSLKAVVIFGNLAGYTNDGGQGGAGTLVNTSASGQYNGKGVGFTMGLTAYDVTSLTLRLNNVNDTAGIDVPTISIYTATSTGVPVTLVGGFTNPSFTAGSTAANYTFTPASSITLNASTRYVIVVQQLNVSGGVLQEFNWLNGNGTVTPTGVASTATAVFGANTATSSPTLMTGVSSQYNWFELNGTVSAIPEPGTYAALAGAASLAFVMVRRSRRQSQP
ncbi:MAG: choice-of-anchor R domain-containing protein [Rariglobus sp.]|nr:choice-of-anchor R domain-containing protein [Rariglobus sp.]